MEVQWQYYSGSQSTGDVIFPVAVRVFGNEWVAFDGHPADVAGNREWGGAAYDVLDKLYITGRESKSEAAVPLESDSHADRSCGFLSRPGLQEPIGLRTDVVRVLSN